MNTGSVYLCNKEWKLCKNIIWFVCDDIKEQQRRNNIKPWTLCDDVDDDKNDVRVLKEGAVFRRHLLIINIIIIEWKYKDCNFVKWKCL